MASTNKRQDAYPPQLGFIAVEINFHRPPGDPFNERTWSFPILKRIAKGSQLSTLVSANGYSKEFIDNFVEAGQWLADQGCVGIITSCGFLAMAQPELSERLPIPIATSSLLQIPAIRALLGPKKSIGVVTFDSARLSPKHFTQLGIFDLSNIHVLGCPDSGHLRGVIRDGKPYDRVSLADEIVKCAKLLVAQHSDMGAFVLECTQLPVFAKAIQVATGLPVFDVVTLGNWFYSGLVRRDFSEWTEEDKKGAMVTRQRSTGDLEESPL